MAFKPKNRNLEVGKVLCSGIGYDKDFGFEVTFKDNNAHLVLLNYDQGVKLIFPKVLEESHFKITGVSKNGKKYEVDFTFDSDLELLIESSLGFHTILSKIAGYTSSDKKPETLKGEFSYTTYLGEWNSFPRELLPFVTEYSFGGRRYPDIQWPDPNMCWEKERIKVGGIPVKELVDRGVIRREVKEVDQRGRTVKSEDTFLTINPIEAMRKLEDLYREHNPNLTESARFALKGDMPVESLVRIPPTYDFSLDRCVVESNDYLMVQEGNCKVCSLHNPTHIYVRGLENAAQIESMLPHDKDLKIWATKGRKSHDKRKLTISS